MSGFFWKNLKWQAQKRHNLKKLMGTVFAEKIQCSIFRFLFYYFKPLKIESNGVRDFANPMV
jgi:hypothetical protein